MNPLISDYFFEQNPDKVLGEKKRKKRGDRGEDAYEDIVVGKLADALSKIDVPKVSTIKPKISQSEIDSNTEQEQYRLRLRLKKRALELKLKLALT